jgi:hypothetical protein
MVICVRSWGVKVNALAELTFDAVLYLEISPAVNSGVQRLAFNRGSRYQERGEIAVDRNSV